MAGATHRAFAGQLSPEAMSSLSSAPWNRNRDNQAMRLRALERRVLDLENVLTRAPESQASDIPMAPLYPPAGSLPRTLARIWELRQAQFRTTRQFGMLYDWIVARFPGAISQMERILSPGTLSPTPEDDLELLARSQPPTGVDPEDPISDFEAATGEDNEDDEEDADEHCGQNRMNKKETWQQSQNISFTLDLEFFPLILWMRMTSPGHQLMKDEKEYINPFCTPFCIF